LLFGEHLFKGPARCDDDAPFASSALGMPEVWAPQVLGLCGVDRSQFQITAGTPAVALGTAMLFVELSDIPGLPRITVHSPRHHQIARGNIARSFSERYFDTDRFP
jgi:hypothetical protein